MDKPPKKQTAQDRANQIGVSVQTLHNWRRCGVDTMDDEQVKARLAKIRQLPQGINPEFAPKVSAPIVAPDADPTSVDIESIIAQIAGATDKHSAQTVKTQIDALVNAYKLREAAGKYVSKSIVDEALIRIGAAVKAACLRLEADLPPMLEGQSPAQMQTTIRQKVDEVMNSLADATSKVWQEHDE
jgi:hypothetical protein